MKAGWLLPTALIHLSTVSADVSDFLAFFATHKFTPGEPLGPPATLHLHNATTRPTPTITGPSDIITNASSSSLTKPTTPYLQTNTWTGPSTTETYVVTITPYTPTTQGTSTFTNVYTKTVDVGSQIWGYRNGTTLQNTTLYGPTTWIATATAIGVGDYGPNIHPLRDPNDPHCRSYDTALSNADHFFTYRELKTVLGDHTTVTTTYLDGLQKGYFGLNAVTKTLIGPTIVYATITSLIEPLHPPMGGDPTPEPPYQICAGGCGQCQLFYPSVSVFYWPVASPNTACLNSSTGYTATALPSGAVVPPSNMSAAGMMAHARGLYKRAGESTLVENGFTFTSPSVYIALPTISAYDMCGIIGDVHTSTTLAFAPDRISTVVFAQSGVAKTFPFNFADAVCPPSSIVDPHHYMSFIGEIGYNPIIAALPDFTRIDPKWNGNCRAADFQGHDPPHVLKPATNLDPATTVAAPLPVATPASPSPTPVKGPLRTASAMDPPPAPKQDPQPVPTIIQNSPPSTPEHSAAPLPADPQSLKEHPAPAPAPADPQPPKQPAPPASADPKSPNQSPVPVPANTNQPAAPAPNTPAPNTPAPNTSAPKQPNSPASDPQLPSNNGSPQSPGNHGDPQASPANPTDPGAGRPIFTNAATPLAKPGEPPMITARPIIIPVPAAQQPGPQVVTLGGQAYTPNAASQYTIEGQTVKPGEIVTIAGAPAIVPLQPAQNPMPQPITIAGTTYAPNAASAYTINGQTAKPGDTVTISGVPVLIPSSLPQNQPQTQRLLTFEGQTYTPNAASAYIVNSQTVKPGDTITIAGSAVTIPSPSPAPVIPGIVLAGTTYTADSSSNFLINGQTAKPGDTITLSGTPIYIPAAPTLQMITVAGNIYTADAASNFVIGGQTINPGAVVTLSGTAFTVPTLKPTMSEIFTFGGKTYTADAASNFVIGGQTVNPGAVVTFSGTAFTVPTFKPTMPEIFTFGGKTYTADAASDFVIGGQTLRPGQAITVSGTPISLGIAGTDVVVGTSTLGLGNIIMGAFSTSTVTSGADSSAGANVRSSTEVSGSATSAGGNGSGSATGNAVATATAKGVAGRVGAGAWVRVVIVAMGFWAMWG